MEEGRDVVEVSDGTVVRVELGAKVVEAELRDAPASVGVGLGTAPASVVVWSDMITSCCCGGSAKEGLAGCLEGLR